MVEHYFTAPDTWVGGYYELLFEVGKRSDEHSDERLLAVLKAIWMYPALDGCYLSRDKEPHEQKRIHPTHAPEAIGVATLPNGAKTACGTYSIRIDDSGVDYACLYFPLGGLGKVYDVGGFPFDKNSHEKWRRPLDAWLAEIGQAVYHTAHYQLGLIDFEILDLIHSSEIATAGVPAERRTGYLWAAENRLQYYPATIWY